VYIFKKLKRRKGPKDCRAIEEKTLKAARRIKFVGTMKYKESTLNEVHTESVDFIKNVNHKGLKQ
jgi:hypothetical protein